MFLTAWGSRLYLAVAVILFWANTSCCDNRCIAYLGTLLCQSVLLWALLHGTKLITVDLILPTVIHLCVNFLLIYFLCARMCREVGFGDVPVLLRGTGKKAQLLHTSRLPRGPVLICQHWEHGCTLVNARSVRLVLTSSGKFIRVGWWACDYDSAEFAACTVWLLPVFLEAAKGQTRLNSAHDLQT